MRKILLIQKYVNFIFLFIRFVKIQRTDYFDNFVLIKLFFVFFSSVNVFTDFVQNIKCVKNKNKQKGKPSTMFGINGIVI